MQISSQPLSAGVLSPNQATVVREYLAETRTRLGLGRAGAVLANVLMAGKEGLVSGVSERRLLPRSDGDRLRQLVERLHEQNPDLPDDFSRLHIADSRYEAVAGRLIGFLVNEMSARGQRLFPDLLEMCRLGAEFEEAGTQATLEDALQQLGGEQVEVRGRGLQVLHDELVSDARAGDAPLIPLADCLTARGYSREEAHEVLGYWLYDKVGSLDYQGALRQLRGLRRGEEGEFDKHQGLV